MRSLKRRKHHTGVALEPLDRRVMLTGNVLVSLSAGELTVRGDNLENQIEISQPAPGKIHVRGLDGTKVNGKPSVDITGRTNDLSILMQQGGADQISVNGPLKLAGDVRAMLEQGAFMLEGTKGPVDIGDDLTIRTGAEADVTIVNAVHVTGDTDIRAGGSVAIAAGQAATTDFHAAEFSDSLTVDNPYFPLVPGTTYTYAVTGIDQDTGEEYSETIIFEVLSDTKTILGVEAVVVRDRVYLDGALIEDTFDWFAQDDNGNVWYLGEAVTDYHYDDAGNVIGTDHNGSWEAGEAGAMAGIIMEAKPRVGHRYYQEFQPGGVVDQAVGLARNETVEGPLGTFRNVFRTRDTSVREPFGISDKSYAPGLGTVREVKYNIETNEVLQTAELISVTLHGVPTTTLVAPTGFEGVNARGSSPLGGVEFDDEVRIRAKGSVLLSGASLEDSASISSGAEVAIIDSVFSDSLWIQAGDNVALRNVGGDDRISILGDVDIFVLDSDIHDLWIRQGISDNTLTFEGSNIGRLSADGGRGTNLFEDRGDNFFGRLLLRRLL